MNLNFQNKPSLKHSRDGFTLLEVLIAMAILVFISFAIYQATIETYRLRDALMTEGDFYNGIRLSTTIMERDISLIYSPLISIPEKKPVLGQIPSPGGGSMPPPPVLITSGNGGDDLTRSTQFWSPAIDDTGVRPSHFVGTEAKLSFISVSNVRIYKDSHESEFSKITYELKKDKDSKNSDTQVLVKTESSNVFSTDEKDSFKHSYEILHGIKKLSYTYYKRDGNAWKTSRSWDSEKEEPVNSFPDIIELSVEVLGPQKQSFEGIFKFRPEIPLNGINPSI